MTQVHLTASELAALRDVRDFSTENVAYLWKPKTMAKLESKGLVRPGPERHHLDLPRGFFITDTGLSVLAESE